MPLRGSDQARGRGVVARCGVHGRIAPGPGVVTDLPVSSESYQCFAELTQHETEGTDYAVRVSARPTSPVLVVAPHGGGIEAGTSELAASIACDEHNLFTFDGLKPSGNRRLHIGSKLFDHPECVALLSRCAVVLGIHGCRGEGQIYVGGLESRLMSRLVEALISAGLPATTCVPTHLAGRDPLNICNRGIRRQGAQLEITMDLRLRHARAPLADAVRRALSAYLCE